MKKAGLPCSVIAIPVKNEAERVAACLGAIAGQRDAPPAAVILVRNNCTDESAAIARQFAATSPLAIHTEHRALPASLASAGIARRLAMEWAADIVAPDGVILTTDADGVVPPDWLAANLAALRRADAVAGRAFISPEEARMIPAGLHADDARECDYAALLDEIASVLDPAPHDPWPRHTEENGASIAVSAPIYRKAGGMPARAFTGVTALRLGHWFGNSAAFWLNLQAAFELRTAAAAVGAEIAASPVRSVPPSDQVRPAGAR